MEWRIRIDLIQRHSQCCWGGIYDTTMIGQVHIQMLGLTWHDDHAPPHNDAFVQSSAG